MGNCFSWEELDKLFNRFIGTIVGSVYCISFSNPQTHFLAICNPLLNVELVLNVHFPEGQYTDNIRYFTIYCLFIILLFKRLTDNGQIVCIFLTDRKLIIKLAR